MSRRRWIVWIVALAVGLVVGSALAFLWMVRNPIAFHVWSTRRALYDAGFVQLRVGAPGGGMVVFVEAGDVPGAPGAAGPTGPPLVFLHGAGDQAGGWAEVAPAFSDRYRVIVPDLAGHGESDPEEGPLPFDLVVEGFEAMMRELGIGPGAANAEPAVLVGNSMGAWVASVYARRHPDRVARLVLVGGGPLRSDAEIDLLPGDRDEARELMALLRDPGSEPIPGFVLDDVVERSRTGPIGRLYEAAASMDKYLLEEADVEEIGVPADLLWGASDRLFPESYARRLAGRLPRSRLTLIEGCGHVPGTECPERFRSELARLLALPPPGADGAPGASAPTGAPAAGGPGEGTG